MNNESGLKMKDLGFKNINQWVSKSFEFDYLRGIIFSYLKLSYGTKNILDQHEIHVILEKKK
jgi:hypothetical protein